MIYDLEKFFDLSTDLLCIGGMDGCFRRVNPAFEHTLGWAAEELLSRPFLDFVFPDDVHTTEREIEKLLNGIPTVSFENRMICLDGSIRYLSWTAFPEIEKGVIYAVARDISSIKRAQEMFHIALESSPSGMCIIDEDGLFVYVNQEIERLFGYKRLELLGQSVEALVPKRFRASHVTHRFAFLNASQTRKMGTGIDLYALRKDGSEFPVDIGLTPITSEDGDFILTAIVDLSVQKEAEKRNEKLVQELEALNNLLAVQATTDSLTNLLNRRAFFEQFDEQIRYARRFRHPLSIMLIDVDHFKHYNDTYGHPAGDKVLRDFGRILEISVRDVDVVARIGGEEFAILLPDTDSVGIRILAQRLFKAIGGHSWSIRQVTASMGGTTRVFEVADNDQTSDIVEMLMNEADQALYRSKKKGRNNFTHHSHLVRPEKM